MREDLAEGHYPTGRVAFEDVRLLLLDLKRGQFGIRPLRAHWQRVLTSSLDAYERGRTWAGRGPGA